MKKALCFTVLIFVVFFINSCINRHPPEYYNQFRFGPIHLKIDDEWIITENGKRYLRLGFDKIEESPDDIVYKNISPEALAIDKSSTTIILEKGDYFGSFEINYYDIPIESNDIWIDLYFNNRNTYTEGDDRVRPHISAIRRFYFYHPVRKKWWGKYRDRALSLLYLNEDLYNNNFETLQDLEAFLDEWNKKSEFNSSYDWKILDKRVLRIPSTKVYDEQLNGVLEEYRMFSWYVETAEKKNVKPKTDDE